MLGKGSTCSRRGRMSKELEPLCETCRAQRCALPQRVPGKGRKGRCPQRGCGRYGGVPAGEVPLHVSERFFQLLSRHFPELGVPPAAPKGTVWFCCAESWSSTVGAPGRGEAAALLKAARNLPELQRAGAAAAGSRPPPGQDVELL